MLTIIAVVLLATAPGGVWYEHYENGVRLVAQGQASAALPELQAAAALRGKEGLQVPTRPQQYLDYLPHLCLALAESSGVAARSRRC